MTIHLLETFIPSWFIQSRIVAFEGSPGTTSWMQAYDPAHHWWLSTAWAALPLVVLLAAMIGLRLVGRESRRLCVVSTEGRGGLADGLARGGGRFMGRERFAAAGGGYRMLLGRRERVRRRPNRTQYYKRS